MSLFMCVNVLGFLCLEIRLALACTVICLSPVFTVHAGKMILLNRIAWRLRTQTHWVHKRTHSGGYKWGPRTNAVFFLKQVKIKRTVCIVGCVLVCFWGAVPLLFMDCFCIVYQDTFYTPSHKRFPSPYPFCFCFFRGILILLLFRAWSRLRDLWIFNHLPVGWPLSLVEVWLEMI